MGNWTEVTNRSVLFGACVLSGLAISWIDGASGLDIAQTALLASGLFLAFLVGEATVTRYRKRR
ncbi:MAG: hypothetical protein WD448_09065 [Woeseia sp.]